MTALFPSYGASSSSFGMGPAPSPSPSPSPTPSPPPAVAVVTSIPTSTTPPPTTTSPLSYTRICIRELDINVREQDIQRYFELTLTVMSRDIEIIKQANKTKCYAFVSIPSSELARLLAMNNTIIPFFNPSKPVLISLAKERKASVVQINQCSPSMTGMMSNHQTPSSPSLNGNHGATSPQQTYPHHRKLSMGVPPLQHFPGAAMHQHNGHNGHAQSARDATSSLTSPRLQPTSAPNSARSYASSPYMSFAASPSISGTTSPQEPTSPPNEQQEPNHVPLFDRKSSFLRSQRQPPFKQKLADLPSTPNTPQPTPTFTSITQSFSNMQLPSPALVAAAAPQQGTSQQQQQQSQQQQQQQQQQQSHNSFMRTMMLNGNTPPHNNSNSYTQNQHKSSQSPSVRSMHPYRSPPFSPLDGNTNNNNNNNNSSILNSFNNNNNNNNNNNFLLHTNNSREHHNTYPGQQHHHGKHSNSYHHHNNNNNTSHHQQLDALLKENAQLKYQQHEMRVQLENANEREREMQITVTALHTQLAEQLMRVREHETHVSNLKHQHELQIQQLIQQFTRDGNVSLTSFQSSSLSSPTPSTTSTTSTNLSSPPHGDVDKEVTDAKPTSTSPSSAFPGITSSIPIRRFSQPPIPIQPLSDDWSDSHRMSVSSPSPVPSLTPPPQDDEDGRFSSHNAMMESFVHTIDEK